MPTKKPKPRLVDISIRMSRKDGKRVSRSEARKALWAAHKIVQKGGSLSTALREWRVHAIDWKNTYPSGAEKEYHYTSKLDEVFGSMGGILETIDFDTLRIEPHTKGE